MDLVDINECVRGAVNILSNQTKYHAQVHVDYGELPKVKGYFGKLNQVFTNMIANANQAVDENGDISGSGISLLLCPRHARLSHMRIGLRNSCT